MNRFRRQPLLTSAVLSLGLLASGVAAAQTAADSTPSVDSLQARITRIEQANQELRTQLAQLRSGQEENWLNERRAEEVKTLVREVLADADTRASLLEGGLTAGHNGKNFFLASDDGSFLMNITGQAQVRYIANFRDRGPVAGGAATDEHEAGFSIRRTKLKFAGHVADPKIGYELTLAAHRDSAAVGMEVVALSYQLTDSLKLTGGRYKAPFLREELISSSRQLTVERSLVNEAFTMGHTEGVGLSYTSENFRLAGMINDGQAAGEIGGDGNDFHNDNVDIAFTTRADVKLAGNWKQWDDTTAWDGEQTALFLGAALHYEVAETGDGNFEAGAVDNFLSWTLDGSAEFNNFGIYGAFVGQHIDSTAGNPNLAHYGALVQGSYLINNKIEPFVRYEWLNVDGATADDVQLLTAGFNYYLRKHDAKFTVDVVYAMDPLTAVNTSLGAQSGLGLLSDVAGEDGQVALRAQFQLLF